MDSLVWMVLMCLIGFGFFIYAIMYTQEVGPFSKNSDKNKNSIDVFIDKSVGTTRTGLNLRAFIGMFIFGWLMKINYDVFGEKSLGWVIIIIYAFLFALGRRQPDPTLFLGIGAIIYIGAWIHINFLLTNKQKMAREQFNKESSDESTKSNESV